MVERLASLEENCLALQALGQSMSSLLGPTTSIKCYVDEESRDSSGGLVLEPLQIINAFTSLRHGHSTNQLLYESCQGQQRECGCGVTTLVCMCGLWSVGVLKLAHQGVPLPVLFALWEQGLQVLEPLFTSHAVSIATLLHDKHSRSHDHQEHTLQKIKAFSRHFSSTDRCSTAADLTKLSSGLAHGRLVAMSLAAEAHRMKGTPPREASVLTHLIVGQGQSSSRVLQGVVANIQSEMISVFPPQTSQLRVAVIDGDCTLTSTHPGLSITKSHDLWHRELTESHWLKQCSAIIRKFDIGLVVVGGVMSPSLWEQCLATRVIVLCGVGHQQREAIVAMNGCKSSYYLQHLTQAHVGTGSVELVEGGWVIPKISYNRTEQKRPIKTYSCCIRGNDSPVVIAMLCGSSECTVDLLSQQFSNCLHRLSCAVADGYVFPGGGVFETACAHKLRQIAIGNETTPPALGGWMFADSLLAEWRPSVWGALADGLDAYTATVVRSVERVKSAERVWDDRTSKKEAWSRALALLRTTCLTEKLNIR